MRYTFFAQSKSRCLVLSSVALLRFHFLCCFVPKRFMNFAKSECDVFLSPFAPLKRNFCPGYLFPRHSVEFQSFVVRVCYCCCWHCSRCLFFVCVSTSSLFPVCFRLCFLSLTFLPLKIARLFASHSLHSIIFSSFSNLLFSRRSLCFRLSQFFYSFILT